ncbi:Hypothetical predicted protein [Olea europaea subsp. europaea]|uniref:Beta-carotene isomerase D27-like C-terminal domain-containing protein n=1 Tax=Olea europaea subsp. europaea TaxID=158383 RepID=A0A8S0RJ29_OLEEU|nr:Hypothetical predicted protein [Olea europaea subsp. europaea]
MGYVLRVRLASFFTGAALASAAGIYFLHKDYKIAHHSISQQVVEVEVNGEKQKSGVLIKKCRYLENSGCVGMCINMCKIPTQDFFTNEFGLPLTMTPNFEDMSCEMVYGQVPPSFEEDPASKQPCYADICSIANPSSSVCPKLQA